MHVYNEILLSENSSFCIDTRSQKLYSTILSRTYDFSTSISMKLSTQERAMLLLSCTTRIEKGSKKSWGEVFTFHLIIALFWFFLVLLYISLQWYLRVLSIDIRVWRYWGNCMTMFEFDGDICLKFLIHISLVCFHFKFWDKIVWCSRLWLERER